MAELDKEVRALQAGLLAKKGALSNAEVLVAERRARLEALKGELRRARLEADALGAAGAEDEAELAELAAECERVVGELLVVSAESLESEWRPAAQRSLGQSTDGPETLSFTVTRRWVGFSAKDEAPAERASSKMQLSRGDTVRELVHQACQLWAVVPGSAVLSAQGALLSDRTPLLDVWRACGGGGGGAVASGPGVATSPAPPGWGGGSPLPSPSAARLAGNYAALGANSPAIAAATDAAALAAAAPLVELLVVPPRRRAKAAAGAALAAGATTTTTTTTTTATATKEAAPAKGSIEEELDNVEVSLGVSPLTLPLRRSARCALLVESALAALLFVVQVLLTAPYVSRFKTDASYSAALDTLVKQTELFAVGDQRLTFNFFSISVRGEIFGWLTNTFRTFLFTSLVKNAIRSGSNTTSSWVLEQGDSALIGELQFRQLRVRANVSCTINAQLSSVTSGCFSPWSRHDQDVSSFGKLYSPGFEYTSPGVTEATFGPELAGAVLRGHVSSYPTDGFIANVGRRWHELPVENRSVNLLLREYDETVASLDDNGWIDEQTSAIMVSFNSITTGTSNTADGSVIVGNTLLFEQMPGSGFITSTHTVTVVEPQPPLALISVGLALLLLGTLVQLTWGVLRVARGGSSPRSSTRSTTSRRAWWARPCLYVDLVLLVLVILQLAYTVQAWGVGRQCITVIDNHRSRFVPLQAVFNAQLVLGSVMPVVVVLLFARMLVGLQLFQTGALLLDAADRVARSILIISLLCFFFLTAVALILWQLLLDDGWFSSWPSTFVLLSVSVDEIMTTFRNGLHESQLYEGFVRWYAYFWLYGFLFAMRVCFTAFACAFAIYHLAQAVAEHKGGLKLMAELRKLRAADAGRAFQDVEDEREL
jgi:hypothetical protein